MGPITTLLFVILATLAAIDQAWLASAALGAGAGLLVFLAFEDCAAATASLLHALGHRQEREA